MAQLGLGFLGPSDTRTYTPDDQARYTQQYPGLEWVNGQPYTRATDDTPDPMADYLGANADPALASGATNTLRPAELTTRFPWEFVAAQIAAPAIASGIGALGGGGAASSAAPSAATSTYGGLPITSALPSGGASVTSLAAPGGGGGMLGGLVNRLGGRSGLLDLGGRVLSNVSQGMTDDRAAQDLRALNQDSLAQRSAEASQGNMVDRAQVQLDQQKAQREAEADAFKKAMQSAILMNWQPTTIDRSQFRNSIPDIRFNVPDFGEQGRLAASTLNTSAQRALEAPPAREALPEYQAPTPSETSSPSFWERLAGLSGLTATTLGAQRQVPRPTGGR